MSKEIERLFSKAIAESSNGEHNIDNSWHKIKEALLSSG